MEPKSLVQKLVKQQQMEGNLQSKQSGKPQLGHLTNAEAEVKALVAEHPDATLMELCELFALSYRKLGESGSHVSLCDKN
jgi:putative transposase